MPSQAIHYSTEIPIIDETDILVAGGGPGGIAAAVMAARQGARVMLVERYGQLGGMAASGEVQPFMGNHAHGETLDKPIYPEWIARMHDYLPPAVKASNPLTNEANESFERMINKEHAVLAAEDLCLEAGVKLLYHHNFVDTIVKDREIESIIVHSKSGLGAIKAKIFIDATGDGDVADRSGNRCEYGGPSGHGQPMTLCFKLGNVKVDRILWREEITPLYNAAVERGDIDCPRENVLIFKWVEPDVIHFNTTRVIRLKATEGAELSEAEIIGRRQMRQIIAFMRKEIPGFEEATIQSMGYHIGVRESRRVVGRYMLRRDAFYDCRKFPDAISRVRYVIDIHNPDGKGTVIETLPPNEWYEIPYGCIVAADIDNLLMAGRPISVDHAIHSSTRVMGPAMTIGQAAGMAAAMAAELQKKPHELDGREVRAKLRETGAHL